jgi:hypothetical protein
MRGGVFSGRLFLGIVDNGQNGYGRRSRKACAQRAKKAFPGTMNTSL